MSNYNFELLENEITVENLLKITAYGTSLTIKHADTGRVVISGVSQLKNSKDKRQAEKWEAIRSLPVGYIKPIATAGRQSDVLILGIEASIGKHDFDEYQRRVKCHADNAESE